MILKNMKESQIAELKQLINSAIDERLSLKDGSNTAKIELTPTDIKLTVSDNINYCQLIISMEGAKINRIGYPKEIFRANVEDNYYDDTMAAANLIPVGGSYHTDGVVKVRLV